MLESYFDIEKIFSYLIKIEIIERWMKLDKKTGEQMFNDLLTELVENYELPAEFTKK